jgi:cell pole-organizing protein PopZ
MTQAAKAQEPSMEEILASIRRIIADDDARSKDPEPPKPAPAPVATLVQPAPVAAVTEPEPEPELEPEAEADILDLTEAMEALSAAAPVESPPPREPAPAFIAVEPPAPAMTMPPNVAEAQRQFSRETSIDRSLLSPTTTAVVDSAFSALAQTVLVQNAQTLDGLVREMLRPMLKVWLDDNLPSLVERLVRAEIERVSRGR